MDLLQNGNCCQCIYNSSDNDDVIKKLSCITSLYAYLSRHFLRSPIILFRNLSYVKDVTHKSKNKYEKSVDKICNFLSLSGLEDRHLLKKYNLLKEEKYVIDFKGFFDGDSECEWETVQAFTNISVVHQWNNRRKFSFGRKTVELCNNIDLLCNNSGDHTNEKCQNTSSSFQFSRTQLFEETRDLRVTYSYLLFQVKAFERRKREVLSDKCLDKLEEKTVNQIYPVNYETKFPFYKHDDDCSVYLVDGRYELRLEVSANQPNDEHELNKCKKINHINDVKQLESDNRNNEHGNNVVNMNINKMDEEEGIEDDGDGGGDDECSELSGPRVWIVNGDCNSIKIDVNSIQNHINTNNNNINNNNNCNSSSNINNNSSSSNNSNKKLREYTKWPKFVFQLTTETPIGAVDRERSNSVNEIASTIDAWERISNGYVGPHIKRTGSNANLMNGDQKIDQFIVVYKFFNKDNLIQYTQTQSLKCPWCSFNRCNNKTHNIKSNARCLIKHLQTFHGRLSFKCFFYNTSQADKFVSPKSGKNGAHLNVQCDPDTNESSHKTISIEVRLNQSYDGSVEIGLRRYCGRLHLARPEKKQLFTQIIYSKHMCQFRNRDPSVEIRPIIWGHNRDYFHTNTGILLHSATDMEIDSELEDHPDWLRHQYDKRIEEFTDVNPGEKRIMQLWNCHLLRYKYHGDYAVSALTTSFIRKMGPEMRQENLRCNLIVHLCNLVDYGLMTPKQLVDAIITYDALDVC